MDFFNRLGDRVYEAWRKRDFNEGIFHEVAVAETSALRPSDHVSLEDIVNWVHDAPRIAAQGDHNNPFGSPPVTVFRADRFYIEVLFWVDASTAIHQHGFSGAFHVLAGSSIQAEYAFHDSHRYSDRLKLGELELLKVEHLKKGDVRSIQSGSALIHSLFHLERPSVSVVVRTNADPLAGPQYSYSRAGIASDPFFMTDVIKKQQQTLGLLETIKHPDFLSRARRTVESADAFATHSLMTGLGAVLDDEGYAKFVDGLKSPHGPLIERLSAAREDSMRLNALIERRKRIHSPEHRFLLALMLNIPSRKRILDLVRETYPGVPPTDTIVRWVSELAETKLDDGANALDIEMNESALRIFAHLVEGATDDQVLSRLREEYGDVDDQEAGVRELCQAFRKSLVFQTLFL